MKDITKQLLEDFVKSGGACALRAEAVARASRWVNPFSNGKMEKCGRPIAFSEQWE